MRERKHLKYILTLFVCFATITTSCSKKDIIPEDKMIAVLKDAYLAESMFDVKHGSFDKNEESRKALLKAVLEKHGITDAQFDSSLVWYSDNAQLFIRINDSTISELRSEVKEIDMKYTKQRALNGLAKGSLPSSFYLSFADPLIRFNLDSIQLQKHPNFGLSLKTLGALAQDSVELSLAYTFNDTVITQQQFLQGNRAYNFDKAAQKDPSRKLISVSGYIYVDPFKIGNRNILLSDISIK